MYRIIKDKDKDKYYPAHQKIYPSSIFTWPTDDAKKIANKLLLTKQTYLDLNYDEHDSSFIYPVHPVHPV